MAKVIGPDVSFWEDDVETEKQINFFTMRLSTPYVIIRAGQNAWVDSDFAYNWQKAKEAGLARGSYWFYDSRVSPTSQADLWFAQVKGDNGELPWFADFEENYGGAYGGWTNFKIFLERIKQLAPQKEIGIYTAFYYWEETVVNANADLAFFHQFPLWIANYATAKPLVPAPWEMSEWLFWQYTDKGNGNLYGVESSNVDLNYFNGDEAKFNTRFNIGAVVPPMNTDKVQETHPGIILHEITRFGTTCFVHVIDLKAARIEISSCGYRTPLYAMGKYDAQIVSNGGGWPNVQDTEHRSNEMWVSNGQVMQSIPNILDNRPYINVSKDGIVTVSPTAEPMPDLYNAVGFDRILVWGGIFNEQITERTTKDARTGSGVTADDKFVLLSAEGNDYKNTGLTFPEMAAILLEFGVLNGGNNDGGSSTCIRNSAVSGEPLFKGSDGTEASVINHIMVFPKPIDPSSPPTGEIMATKKGVAKQATNIKAMSGVPSGAVATLPINGWVFGNLSSTGTDLVDINEWFRPSGEKVPLNFPCKASVSNLTVTKTEIIPPPPSTIFPPEVGLTIGAETKWYTQIP